MARSKKFSKPELSRMINGDIPFDDAKTANEPADTTRLDILVQNQYPQYSRSTIQKYIKAGYVTVNQSLETKPNAQIPNTDDLRITLNALKTTAGKKPPVIYEDESVIVFNKPYGMLSINKGSFNPEPAIENWGEIVHRLDRDTSGVIIVAKNPETKSLLQKQFQDRKAHKTYYAVVEGVPKQDHAIINVPIARNLKRPTTFIVDPSGREAITEYKVILSNGHRSLIELKPKTGRTHQLRIHMSYIKCPILGDPIYNTRSDNAVSNRMYLHATALEITIPDHGQKRRATFEAPLPNDFREIVGCS